MGFIDEMLANSGRHAAMAWEANYHQARRQVNELQRELERLRRDLKALAEDRDRWRFRAEEVEAHIEALQEEIERLRLEKDWDACVIEALAAQRNAFGREIIACPNHDAHPLREESAQIDVYKEAYKREWYRREIPGDPEEALQED